MSDDTIINELEELIIVLQTELDQSETWRPVATAPRDGSSMLMYCPDTSDHICVMYWDMEEFIDFDDRNYEVTHWMPLPGAPE